MSGVSVPHLPADDVRVATRGCRPHGHVRPRLRVDVHQARQIILVHQQGQQAVVGEEGLVSIPEGSSRPSQDGSSCVERTTPLNLSFSSGGMGRMAGGGSTDRRGKK